MLMLGYKERSEFQLRVGLVCCGKGCEAWQASHTEGVVIIPILSVVVHMSLDKDFSVLWQATGFEKNCFILQLSSSSSPVR